MLMPSSTAAGGSAVGLREAATSAMSSNATTLIFTVFIWSMIQSAVPKAAEGGKSMAWWVYKCNGKVKRHGNEYIGDWRSDFFDFYGDKVGTWGITSVIPQLAKLEPGDSVFAYETERKEL